MAAKKQTKPEPTAFTIEVSNPCEFEVPLPTGVDKLDPGESRRIHVTKQKLGLYRSNRFLEVEITGDNSEAVAEAEKQRDQSIANAKERHAALSKTRDEARAEEKRIREALEGAEGEERDAEANDREAKLRAGRSREDSAAGVLTSAGAKSSEIEGLHFDLWGARVRRKEAEAAVLEVESILAADESTRRRSEIHRAEKKVQDAQDELDALRSREEREFGAPDKLSKDARRLRQEAAALDSSGPQSIAS